jgi:hypothetical protein
VVNEFYWSLCVAVVVVEIVSGEIILCGFCEPTNVLSDVWWKIVFCSAGNSDESVWFLGIKWSR